ncbi:MAG: hypothetical protein R3Y53_01885 [Bacillota bacterium]
MDYLLEHRLDYIMKVVSKYPHFLDVIEDMIEQELPEYLLFCINQSLVSIELNDEESLTSFCSNVDKQTRMNDKYSPTNNHYTANRYERK